MEEKCSEKMRNFCLYFANFLAEFSGLFLQKMNFPKGRENDAEFHEIDIRQKTLVLLLQFATHFRKKKTLFITGNHCSASLDYY